MAGHVVDRVAARPLLVALGLAEALVCAGLAVLTGVAAALGLLFALNCLVAVSVPCYTARAVAIAGPGHAQRAQSPLQAAQGLAMVVGPMLGGLRVGLVGQRWPLGLDAGSFALAGAGTALVVHDRRPAAPGPGEHVSAFAGIALVARDALLRPLAVDIFAFLATLGVVNVAEVFFVTQTLHGSPLAHGALGASFGAGTVVAGVAVGIANVMAIALFSQRAAEHLHGRVFAALGAITTAADVGATVAGGALLTILTPRTVYALGGAAATVVAVVFGALAMRAVARRGAGA
ncbi:MAG: MFS transporter [Acidimicrobiales bacterium]